MQVSYACSRCEARNDQPLEASTSELACDHCQAVVAVPADAVDGGKLACCIVCQRGELFVRKDFPQCLGVAIVVVGFAASCVAWHFYWIYTTFAILFASLLLDFVLYLVVGNALACYRCGAQYRGVEGLESHDPFQLERHERYRQEAARLAAASPVPDAGKARP